MDLIVHALIIAALTALASGFVAGRVMEAKMGAIVDRLVKLEYEVQRLRDWRHNIAGDIGWVNQQRRHGHDRRVED